MNINAVPETTMLSSSGGGVRVIAGPGWRDHLAWRIHTILDESSVQAYWMGSGRLGNGFPPSGILSSPSADITRLVKDWSSNRGDTESHVPMRRVLVVEDPQGAGIWEGLNRCAAWKMLLENAVSLGCMVLVGTSVGIPRAGLLLEYTDWFHLRCGGGEGAVEELTSGSTSLGTWLDGVGRDIFDDIRVYRRILSVMAQHGKDVVIWLSNENEDFTERVFWWDPSREITQPTDTIYALQSRRRRTKPRESDGGSAITTSRIVRKLRLVVGLLEELCEELDDSDGSDEE